MIVDPEILFESVFQTLRLINEFNKADSKRQKARPPSVPAFVIHAIVEEYKHVYKDILTHEERESIRGDFKADKLLKLLTSRLSAQQQSELIDECLRPHSYLESQIPGYIKVTLSGVSMSQKFYMSLWQDKESIRDRIGDSITEMKHSQTLPAPGYGIQIGPCRKTRPGGIPIGCNSRRGLVEIHNDTYTNRMNNFLNQMRWYFVSRRSGVTR
jgi:hypothetical protein